MRTTETQDRMKNLLKVINYLQNTEEVGKVEIKTWGEGQSAILLHPTNALAQETRYYFVTHVNGLISSYNIYCTDGFFKDAYLVKVEKGPDDVRVDEIHETSKKFHSWAHMRIRGHVAEKEEEEQKDVV